MEGDENSKFFHRLVKQQRRQNTLTGIMVEGNWINEPAEVKNQFFNFYKDKFKRFKGAAIANPSARYKHLSNSSCEKLISTLSMEEIKNAVWSCGGDRASGPDGFSFKFVRKFWDILKNDIYGFIDDFFQKWCNPSWLQLIIHYIGA